MPHGASEPVLILFEVAEVLAFCTRYRTHTLIKVLIQLFYSSESNEMQVLKRTYVKKRRLFIFGN